MILMLPFLLITLHFSQIGFTEDLTFMMNPPFFAPSARVGEFSVVNFWNAFSFCGLEKSPRAKVRFIV